MAVARAFQHAPRPKEPVVQQKARPAKVARSPRSARDPRYMRAVDRLQRTADREPYVSLTREQPAPRAPDDLRLSSVLEAPQAARVSSPGDPAEREAES